MVPVKAQHKHCEHDRLLVEAHKAASLAAESMATALLSFRKDHDHSPRALKWQQ